tara:strand:+ start:82 stop:1086 length:1005 start_codon:yes stop_codon:yes gene_type:complete
MLISYGTRPEYIKIKPILDVFKGEIPYKILFTGQHTSLLPPVKDNIHRLHIKDGPNRLDSIVASVLNNEDIFKNVTSVLVQGDTTSAFAIALAAFHRKIPVLHLEAGLRTYDLDHPYPEEFNRQAISRLAAVNLCPTARSYAHVEQEKTPGQRFVVGNTVLDNLVDIKPTFTNKVIVTLHRRENHHWIDQWFKEIDTLASKHLDLEFILPIHPNPAVKKHEHLLKHVKVVDPVPYDEFTKMLAECKFAITDSGGLQEELSFFGKLCIVCREQTERIMGLGTFSYLCLKPKGLEELFNKVNDSYNTVMGMPCPYGNGKSAETILKLIKDGYIERF